VTVRKFVYVLFILKVSQLVLRRQRERSNTLKIEEGL